MKIPALLVLLLAVVIGAKAQPVITAEPVSQAASLSSTVTFSVTATDTNPISYQWQFNGTAIDLATSPTLTLNDVTVSQAGTYTVYVYDSVGGVTSSGATLTITGGPVINSNLNVTAYAQTIPFLYTITAEYPATSFGATGLPPGLSVNPTTGVISGIATTTGTFEIALTATDASGTSSATLHLSVSLPPYVLSGLNVTPNIPFSKLAGIVSGGPNLFYIADTGNDTIYQFDPSALTATVLAGSTGVVGSSDGTGITANFNNPTGLAIDRSGNIYVADTANSTIRKISSTGIVSTIAGVAGEPGSADGPSGTAHFNYPQGVAVDSSGNVYVADTGNYTIREISESGTVTTLAGRAGSPGGTDGTGSGASFGQPTNIVIDSKGNLYVEDYFNSTYLIRKMASALVTTIVRQPDSPYGPGPTPGNLAIDSNDNVFFAFDSDPTFGETSMTEITPGGATFSVGPAFNDDDHRDSGPLPTGMAFDSAGHIFATFEAGIYEGTLAYGPIIQSQPSISISGQTATISISADGSPEPYPFGLTYRWLLNGLPASYPTETPTISVPISPTTVGTYSVIVSGGFGSTSAVVSDGVTLSLTPAFSISSQPTTQAVAAGASATFSVTTSATVSPTYQWAFDGTPIVGATSQSYTVSHTQLANSGAYTVTVTDQGGGVTSEPAFLTIAASSGGPSIASQPQSVTTYTGGTVVLSVSVSSALATVSSSSLANAADTYQWFLNGAALADESGISGSQSATLVLSGAGTVAGSYSCLVENSLESVVTAPAILTVTQANDTGRLTNVSCRAKVETGSNILIAGFIVGGNGASGTESVLIRASGPALIPFDVSGTLSDPELQLFATTAGSSLVATNTGWDGSALIATTAAAVGAFAWTESTSHDDALVEDLEPGSYTANVSGQSGDEGVALAEVYDATPEGSYSPTSPRLTNVSARVQVGTGGDVLIAGFIIGGSTAKTVLIRAWGPALAPFGIAGTLPDPMLQLYQSVGGGSSTLLGANTGWGGNPQIAAEAADVGAFSWGNAATADSALLVTLQPGAYTAQVSGASGDTGVALVEIYEVP